VHSAHRLAHCSVQSATVTLQNIHRSSAKNCKQTDWAIRDVLQAELLLAPKCVCNTVLCVRVCLMFWSVCLSRRRFKVTSVWRPSISKTVCDFIVVRLLGPSSEVKRFTPSCAEVKNFSPPLCTIGWTSKLYLCERASCAGTSHTTVVWWYGPN
jgi:hypothetical protein